MSADNNFTTWKSFYVLLVCYIVTITVSALGEEHQKRAFENELWKDNKFTSDQPWPGKVISVGSSWVAYTMVITDIATESKLCSVDINVMGSITYHELEGEREKQTLAASFAKGTLINLSPGVEVGRFSWSIGADSLGRRFGEKDLLLIAAKRAARNARPLEVRQREARETVAQFMLSRYPVTLNLTEVQRGLLYRNLFNIYDKNASSDNAEAAKRISKNEDIGIPEAMMIIAAEEILDRDQLELLREFFRTAPKL